MKRPDPLSGWRLHAARVLAILAVVGLSLFLFSYRDEATRLAAYGYPGLFLFSVLSNATVILPMPGVALTFTAGAVLHPVIVGLIAGVGSTFGELTGYLAGFSGQAIVDDVPLYQTLKGWTERYGQWAILVLAIIPNPLFDIAGAAAGALKMPVHQFLIFAGIGKTIKMLAFAFAGAQSAVWVLEWLGP